MNQNQYYAATAYDSTKRHAGFPNRTDDLGFSKRQLLRNPLPRVKGTQCAEMIGRSRETYILEQLKADTEQMQEELQEPHHEIWIWATLHNPKVALYLFTQVMLFFGVCFIAGDVLIFFIFLFTAPGEILTIAFFMFLLFSLLPTVLHKIGKQLLKSDKIQYKNNIIFNRRTGMVTVPWRKEEKELAFADFGSYMNTLVNPSGSQEFNLLLCHYGTNEIIQTPGGEEHPYLVALEWEFMQQYMDISQPLPDVPSMESFRAKDPVTAEYDQRHNRPPRYWRDMDIEKAEKMHDASNKAASEYPWGLTREQAIASGWQPSGFGEGDWRK